MPDPGTFKLGIIGGCMSHQVGIPMDELYHRRLAGALDASSGTRLRVHIARSFGAGYARRLESLLERRTVDGVLLHLRVTIYKRSRLVFSQVVDGRRHRFVNPVLLDRRHHGPRVDALRGFETAGERAMRRAGVGVVDRAARHERNRRRAGGFTTLLQRLNWGLGALAGLDRWAVENEMRAVAEFLGMCDERGLPVFILGPTPLVNRTWQARAPRLLSARIRAFATETGTGAAVLDETHDEEGLPLTKPDGMHLTSAGHAFVARRLLAHGFGEWVSGVMAFPDAARTTIT